MEFKYAFNASIVIIGLCFNLQAIAQSTADCSNPEKKGSSDSTCLYNKATSLNSAIAQPKNHAASAIFPFGVLGKACTTPWGQAVPDNSGVLAYLQPTGHYNYSTGTWGEDCVEEYRYCNNGTLTGTYQYQTCTIAPVNATCGPAQGAYYTYPTSGPSTSSLCNPNYIYGGYPTDGYPTNAAYSAVYLNNNTYTWSCSGDNGGTGTSCYAYRRVDAQCGTDNATNRYSAPTNLCNLGNSSATSGSWNWTCYGINGGNNAPCYANKIVDGVCGSDNNAILSSTPTNLCNSGTASAVSGTGPWNWACYGSNGGSSPSCSANKSVPTTLPQTTYQITASFSGGAYYWWFGSNLTNSVNGGKGWKVPDGTYINPNLSQDVNDYFYANYGSLGSPTSGPNVLKNKMTSLGYTCTASNYVATGSYNGQLQENFKISCNPGVPGW